jgi:cardiolipin synthase
MSELLRSIVSSAQKRLVFVTPYFMPPRSVLRQLVEAVERGVDVTVIIPERCDVWVLDHVIRQHIHQAVSHGINIRICRHSFVHAKLAVVDGRRVVVGSANLDARSINLNREVMVATEERSVVEAADSFVDRLMWLSYAPEERDKRSYIPAFVCRWLEGVL